MTKNCLEHHESEVEKILKSIRLNRINWLLCLQKCEIFISVNFFWYWYKIPGCNFKIGSIYNKMPLLVTFIESLSSPAQNCPNTVFCIASLKKLRPKVDFIKFINFWLCWTSWTKGMEQIFIRNLNSHRVCWKSKNTMMHGIVQKLASIWMRFHNHWMWLFYLENMIFKVKSEETKN